MTYVFDTSAILAHYRQQMGANLVQSIFDNEDDEIVISSVSLTEFARRLYELGANDAEVSKILNAYQALLTRIMPIDEAIAMKAIDISRQSPKRIPLVDALIAATANVCDATLVHADAHMAIIPRNMLNQQYLVSEV